MTKINKTCDTSDKLKLARVLDKSAKFMGLTSGFGEEKFSDEGVDNEKVQELIEKRSAARKKGDFALADEIRQHLLSMGIVVVDTKDGISFSNECIATCAMDYHLVSCNHLPRFAKTIRQKHKLTKSSQTFLPKYPGIMRTAEHLAKLS